jgi:hypothetical protein
MERPMTSNWLVLNQRRIEQLIRDCEIYELKGSYGGSINLKEVIRVIIGAREEINVLSRRIEKLELELEKEKK